MSRVCHKQPGSHTYLLCVYRVPVHKLDKTRSAEGVRTWQQPRVSACVRFQTYAASHTAVYALVVTPCRHFDSAPGDKQVASSQSAQHRPANSLSPFNSSARLIGQLVISYNFLSALVV